MRKPILYMTAAATGLALLQTPLPAQAAPCQPNVSVIRVCPDSTTSVNVNDLLGQFGITGWNQLPDCTPSDCNPDCDNTPNCTTPNCVAPDCDTPDCDTPDYNTSDCSTSDCIVSGYMPSISNLPTQIDLQSYLENWNCYIRGGNTNCNPNNTTVPASQQQVEQPNAENTQPEQSQTVPAQAEQPKPAQQTQPGQAEKPKPAQQTQPEQAKPQAEQPAQPQQPKPQTEQPAQPQQPKPDTAKPATPAVKPEPKEENTQPAANTPSSENSQTTENSQPSENAQTSDQVSGNTAAQQSEAGYHEYVLRIVSLVNEERAKAGLQPVQLSKNVTAVAQLRAQETVSLFSHTRPNGTSCFTALAEAGINYRGAGENIAYGQRSPEEVMNGWMNSSGHRANILNANFTTIGVGYYQAANGVKYWSQMFTF